MMKFRSKSYLNCLTQVEGEKVSIAFLSSQGFFFSTYSPEAIVQPISSPSFPIFKCIGFKSYPFIIGF